MRVIITGTTGMVGEGVLHEALLHPDVEAVLSVSRTACEVVHTKLTEILVPDFFNLTDIDAQLSGYDACFFCLGVSSIGMKEPEYTRLTYELTLNFANAVSKQNKDLVFEYISGKSTDSSEKGKSMWARVKGKTENDLMKLPFKKVYNFRPGYMHPTPGLKRTLTAYKYIGWLFPVMKLIFPNSTSTLKQLGLAMINAAKAGYNKNIIEVKDLKILAGEQ